MWIMRRTIITIIIVQTMKTMNLNMAFYIVKMIMTMIAITAITMVIAQMIAMVIAITVIAHLCNIL